VDRAGDEHHGASQNPHVPSKITMPCDAAARAIIARPATP
jgi:hypothetical protein